MPTNKEGQTTQSTSLSDFNFDNEESFFGIKTVSEDSETSQTIKEVKSESKGASTLKDNENTPFGEEEEDENEGLTFFGNEEEEDGEEDKDDVLSTKKGKQQDTKDEEIDDKDDDKDNNKDEDKDNKKGKTTVKKDTEDTKSSKIKSEDKEEETDADNVEDEDEKDKKFFTTLGLELKEKGLFTAVEIDENEVLTEDQLFEKFGEEVEARVEETFAAFYEQLDEDAVNFIKYKKLGGNTQQFFQNYVPKFELDKLDEDNDKQLNLVLTRYLTTVEQLDDEELADRLKYLEDSGKKKATAIKYFDKLKTASEQQKAAILKQQEEAAEAKKESARKFNEGIKATASKTDKVGAFKLSKTEQKELPDYITKPTVKTGKNMFSPKLYVDLGKILKAETEEDRKNLILLSKLVKSNFDIKDLVADTNTNVVKRVKSKLKEAKETTRPKSSSGSTGKALTDYFS